MTIPPPVMVRRMTAADLEAVLAIAAGSPQAPRWQPSDYAPYYESSPSRESSPSDALFRTAFVAVSSTAILGFAAASLLLARPGDPADESLCELESIAVRPDVRRQGAGTVLLHAVLTWAAQHGARRLALEVRAGNAPALRLYENFGLRLQGRRPGYYTDPPEDALLLAMPVTPVSNTAAFSTGKVVEGRPPRC